MRRYLDGEIEKAYPQQQSLTELEEEAADRETDGGVEAESGTEVDIGTPDITTESPDAPDAEQADAAQDLIDAGESPECPECGSLSLYYSEGCKTCESCGWSEC